MCVSLFQLTIEHNPETSNNQPKRATNTTDAEERNKHDTKSPVERKIHKETKQNIPKEDIPEDSGVRKERLFKRKGEEGGKVRVIKRRQTPSSPLLGEKERSSSMSKLLDV